MDRPGSVLAGLGPAIHALPADAREKEGVGARNKCGHDAGWTPARLRPGRPWAGHPCLPLIRVERKAWVPATSAGVTQDGPARLRPGRPWAAHPCLAADTRGKEGAGARNKC